MRVLLNEVIAGGTFKPVTMLQSISESFSVPDATILQNFGEFMRLKRDLVVSDFNVISL